MRASGPERLPVGARTSPTLHGTQAEAALGDVGLGTLVEGTAMAWKRFRALVKVVQTAVKLQRCVASMPASAPHDRPCNCHSA